MAQGIYKRGEGQWLVRIRQRGKNINQTFESYEDAKDFRDLTVGHITGKTYVDRSKEQCTTLAQLLLRYEKEVSPSKKGAVAEINRLRAWAREPFASWSIVAVTAAEIVEWRDRRVKQGKAPTTISNPMNTLSAVYKKAISEWRYRLDNPCSGVSRPKGRPPRDVRMNADLEARLIAACREGPPWLIWTVRIAIATAMRASEIRRLKWKDITSWSAHLETTKNDTARDVPLTEDAEALIEDMRRCLPHRLDGWVFGPPDLPAIDGGFTRSMVVNHFINAEKLMQKRASEESVTLPHVTFHDLRHVATTRLAPLHRDGLHLAKTTGHKTLGMLVRYFNPSGEEQAKEIRSVAKDRRERGLM